MAELTTDDVMKLAHLSRIELTAEEIEEYTHELARILDYVQQLQAVDVTGLNPTDQVTGLTNVMREDTAMDYGYTPDDILSKSLSVQDRQLKVKRMLQG